MGLEREIGTLEAGKRADLSLIALDALHLTPGPDVVSAIVYAAQAADVKTVLIDGQIVMHERELKTLDEREVIAEAHLQAKLLFARAGIAGER